MRFHVCETDLGWVAFAISNKGVRAITMAKPSRDQVLDEVLQLGAHDPAKPGEAASAEAALQAAIAGRGRFDEADFDWTGITPFRRAVMEECARIPAGQTLTYGQLAERVGRPNAARAVGRVMATNPFPFIVPCHRVVGSDGTLHGYGGGLDKKATLLTREGARF
jgi:methylated-DNA-[protein]-cysteine S-methyltransferase